MHLAHFCVGSNGGVTLFFDNVLYFFRHLALPDTADFYYLGSISFRLALSEIGKYLVLEHGFHLVEAWQ